ncbi:hypothetical protein [Shinella zoogloeoides]|uniref:hypothetical protein n=1 Tax=Shinella zoogloeoides TaxID=352475 RepID=UPI00299E77DA|nr:hypothetical protein [Shinella zoogloeoides]WPE19910.1 hypothetical protein ShzoTeo12_10860 [Shinella zoogloeoides]
MADKRTFSVLIRWNDNDQEQGEFGTIVRADDCEDAETLARADMRASHIENHGEDTASEYEHEDGTFGGSVVEICEGAIWKAKELEAALRAMLNAFIPAPSPSNPVQLLALQEATLIISEIDAIGG